MLCHVCGRKIPKYVDVYSDEEGFICDACAPAGTTHVIREGNDELDPTNEKFERYLAETPKYRAKMKRVV